MATLSLRQVATNCLGLAGTISVNDQVYGYPFRAGDGSMFGTLAGEDFLPVTGTATGRSVKRHLQTISATAVDLVLILVGHEDDFSGAVSREQVATVQYAVQMARDLYAQVGFGIRRLRWSKIPPADAGGYVDIANRAEAQDLTQDFNGPDGGIDVFLVQSIGDAGGWSNVDGPCDKESKFDLSGAVIALSSRHRFLGIVLGHEVGHYLGLVHTTSMANMMGADTNNDGIGETDINSTFISAAEGSTMRSHCSALTSC